MDEFNIVDVICKRQLNLKNGERVNIYIFKPIKVSEFEYECNYRLDGLEKKIERISRGVDSVQVIIFALDMVGMYLRNSIYAKSGEMSWFEDQENFGFPLSLGSV